jgi:dienelactone hydrolase
VAAAKKLADAEPARCRFAMLVIAAWLGFGQGGLTVAEVATRSPIAAVNPALLGFDFDYERSAIHPTDRVDAGRETRAYRVRALAIPSIGENGQPGNLVSAQYYQSKLAGRHRLVIVLPIWGAQKFPPRNMAKALLRHGGGDMNVLRLLGENPLIDWAGIRAASSERELVEIMQRMVERVRTHVIDIRRWIDWAESEPGVDPGRIGLVGFSMGASVGSLVLANEPRFAAGALALGGANPHEVLSTCFIRKIKKTRKALLSRFHWSPQTLEQKMEQPLAPINPARFTGTVNPQRIIIVEAGRDRCISKSGRDALWHAMGEPRRVIWPINHNVGFLTITPLGGNIMARRIFDFLDQVL